MATEEHKCLSTFIKNVHSELRKAAAKGDVNSAWKEHCSNQQVLTKYAQSMEKLATTYWEENSANSNKLPTSRIEWSANICRQYFHTDLYLKYRNRDIEIAEKINLKINLNKNVINEKIQLLDVGSCYNPFRSYDYLSVLAVDLCPANDDVLKCDFLNVKIGNATHSSNNEVTELQTSSFDAITFCFVLEYLPSSDQRIEACSRAYNLLKPEGLLIIATPDSKHVGANARIMKCWRYTLAKLGLSRIKYEKFPHMHCMAFRKSLHIDIASRWAFLHRQPYMHFELKIPQDFQNTIEVKVQKSCNYDEDSVITEFMELPELYE